MMIIIFVFYVKVLLEGGADVHATDKGGLIPLHNACSYGHFEVAKLLIEVNYFNSLHYISLINCLLIIFV